MNYIENNRIYNKNIKNNKNQLIVKIEASKKVRLSIKDMLVDVARKTLNLNNYQKEFING